MRAVQCCRLGGPEVLTPVELPDPRTHARLASGRRRRRRGQLRRHPPHRSTVDKRDLALRLGADAAVDSAADGYAERIRAANGGRPVDVVLGSTGGAAFTAAMDALAGFGRLVTYGNASREGRPLVDPATLAERNTAVVGFWLRPALALPGAYEGPLTQLLKLAATGRIHPLVGAEYPLAQARRAHEDLLARRTTGKVVLRP